MSNRHSVIVEGVDPVRWVQRLVASFLENCQPVQVATQILAKRIHRDPHTMKAAPTLQELKLHFEEAGLTDGGVDRIVGRVLEASAQQETLSVAMVDGWFSELPGHERWITVLRAIGEFLPPETSPALLVVPVSAVEAQAGIENGNAMESAARTLARLLTELPRASVGIAATEAVFDSYWRISPESFSKAVLRESLIPITGLSAAEISERLAKRGVAPTTVHDPQIVQLANRGASPELLEGFIESVLEQDAATSSGKTTLTPQDGARSQTERFLFDCLENTPDLSGLFKLNVKPGFEFGGQLAEIDLACLSLKIAIEIDGYHHFTNLDAYRRDRRKDLLLQEHGFFVLRFLAEDVLAELELICQTIRTVVQLRNG